ncbi:NAD(P)H-binding protein [Streptomyces sp. NPDC049881]|uniref:SDR family oxidoreductase n=1 Tax=Streptomyces sp. NPDC049881 TaxID=3155778 RepID=UPI0034150596
MPRNPSPRPSRADAGGGIAPTILLTGGRGAIATHLLSLLRASGHPVRVASRAPARLRVPEGVARIACDLGDPATFPAALSGVTSVFLYADASHATEFADAAVAAGVRHVVLLSSAGVLAPDAADDPLAAAHLGAEEALLAAPFTTTLLRPGSFAGNAAAWRRPIAAGLPIGLPYPGAHTDPLHERDIAEAAHRVLTDSGAQGGHFHLTGPESLTFTDQAERIATVTGRPVAVRAVAPEAWKEEMAAWLPAPYADALLRYWRAQDGVPVRLTDAVERLTGRPARPFTDWVRDHAGGFTG